MLSINPIPLSEAPRPYRILPEGTLCFLQEVLGSHLASVSVRKPAKDAPVYSHVLACAKVDARALKMALYGFVVSAPLSHVLVGELQKAFAGRTGRAAKLGQVIASNLIVSPIQTFCKFRGDIRVASRASSLAMRLRLRLRLQMRAAAAAAAALLSSLLTRCVVISC